MKLVFATNNPNKLAEIKALVPDDVEIVSLKDIGCTEEIPETENTLQGNALLKADYVRKNYNLSCFADDTGLEVQALSGRPGVYSARYAGPEATSNDNMEKLLEEMKGQLNRTAQFVTVIALLYNGEEHFFRGSVQGSITLKKSGGEGFGYDPVFQPKGYPVTFAEMNREEKGLISHRGRAVSQLVDFLNRIKAQA